MRPLSLVRGLQPADWLTVGNAACGAGAVLLALAYVASGDLRQFLAAAALAPVAFVLDALDGRVARASGRHSLFGQELDSLADVLSFGMAPAALGFAAGLRGGWDAAVLVFFVCCGVARLARFNATAAQLADSGGKVRYFEGTPIPTSIVLTGLLALAAWQGRLGEALWGGSWTLGPWRLHPLALAFAASGCLMVSKRLRIPKP